MALNGEDVVSFERDDLHRETLRHYANSLSQQQRYDEVGRLTQQLMLNGHDKGYQAQTQNNAIQHTNQLIERLYHYDKTGELTLIKDARRGAIHYKYDPVGRLLEATNKLGKETFNFDPASNILDRYNSTKEQSSQHTATEKGLGYNRLVNNIVQEYLDQQYQYDAFGQLIRQKSSQGDLNLEWDVLGRLVRSRNNQYTAEYRYDALGRRIQKRSKHHHTGQEQNIIYGWDGDTLAYESSADITKHYFYEKDSFLPLLQAAYHHSIELHQTQDWTEKTYSIYKDPLWNTVKQSQGFDDVWFYRCDHLGTPQEMSNQTGAIVWKAQYKAWGECKVEQAKPDFFENSEIISNNIRFQGQYFDGETGLHYNRYRYYSPYVGRFISKDPIGLLGGFNVYSYAPNPNNWIDPLGLRSRNKTLPINARSRNTKKLVNCINADGKKVSADDARKDDFLFNNKNDAMNAGSKMLGPGAVRTYNEKGQWNGWKNAKGDTVYWNHGDWGKGVGTSTFPHLNYDVSGKKGHLFMKDKIENSGMVDDFYSKYEKARGCP